MHSKKAVNQWMSVSFLITEMQKDAARGRCGSNFYENRSKPCDDFADNTRVTSSGNATAMPRRKLISNMGIGSTWAWAKTLLSCYAHPKTERSSAAHA